MMKNLIFIVVLSLCTSACTTTQQPSCIQQAVHDCFNAHGTLMYYANMRPRLQTDDGNLFGIAEQSAASDAKYYWPQNVESNMSFDTKLTGDFHACPITAPHDGLIGKICIEAAKNLNKE